MSAAAGAGSGDAPDPGEGQPPAARPPFVDQVVPHAPFSESMAAVVAELERDQLLWEAEGYCRDAVEHGRVAEPWLGVLGSPAVAAPDAEADPAPHSASGTGAVGHA